MGTLIKTFTDIQESITIASDAINIIKILSPMILICNTLIIKLIQTI